MAPRGAGIASGAKKFFGEHRVAYDWTDIDGHEEGQRIVVEANNGKRIIPTIFFDDGTVLAEPSNVELARSRRFYERLVDPKCGRIRTAFLLLRGRS